MLNRRTMQSTIFIEEQTVLENYEITKLIIVNSFAISPHHQLLLSIFAIITAKLPKTTTKTKTVTSVCKHLNTI